MNEQRFEGVNMPPMHEFLITRTGEAGGDVMVQCHSLGLKGRCLICFKLNAEINEETGEHYLVQRTVRIFRSWIDVQEVDIPRSTLRH